MEVTPARLGLAGASQLALIQRTVTEKGKTTTSKHYLAISQPRSQIDATGILNLRRGHWGIEGCCHQRLDVSLGEDQCRVSAGVGAAVLGLLSRVSLALFEKKRPHIRLKRDRTYPVWSAGQIRRPNDMLRRMHELCLPP